MVFPPWIERMPREQRARARLKFMINHAALLRFGTTSIRKVAMAAGCNHASIFNAIARGGCTEDMADKLVSALAHPQLTSHMLMNPLAAVLSEETAQ